MPIWSPAFFGSATSSGYVIEGSGSFNGTDGKLTRTISSAGNRRTFILEVIFKRGGSASSFLTAYSSGTDTFYFYLSGGQVYVQNYIGANQIELKSDARLRDFSAWYHLIVAIDTTQSTEANRVKAWVNGVELTWASSPQTFPTQNFETKWNTGSQEHQIGHSSTTYSPDYFARAAAYDGQTMTDPATDGFGEYDDNGVWVPLDVSGKTFGTTGFLIEGGAAFTNGTDSSGNSQNFTKGGTITDVDDTLTDKASDNFGNFCTLNPLDFSQNAATLSEGNLKIVGAGSHSTTKGTVFTDGAGKFVWECTVTEMDTNVSLALMRTTDASTGSNKPGATSNSGFGLFDNQGSSSLSRFDGSNMVTGMSGMADGDMYHLEFNNDTGDVYIWRKASGGTWTAENSGNSVTSGAGKTALAGASVAPSVHVYQNSSATNPNIITFNFGATSFDKTPSSNYVSLNTANLAAPTVTDPSAFFQNVLYDGTGSTQSITLGGNSDMQPDFVWIKRRNVTGTNHMMFDSVRGATKFIGSDRTTAETTVADTLTSFDSDGFSLGADASGYGVNVSTSSSKYVAWCWKAGGSGSSNSDGDIASTVSVASHGGFSIVKYDPGSGGSPGDTVGHGLSRAPNYIILKVLEAVGDQNWSVGSDDIGWTNNLFLNLTNAKSAGSGPWNNTAPTSSVFSIGSDRDNDAAYIAYCFAKTPGLIACGSYTGNGSADGTYVVVDDDGSGFKPSFIMIKRTDSTEGWHINDAARDPFNPLDLQLQPNSNGVESGSSYMDFTANGFKLRGTQGATNTSGGTYVYLAMAEHPFGGDGVAQAKGRP